MKWENKNYWSLYLEFIEEFKKLKYKGIPIPIICNFSELIKDNAILKGEMKKPYFINNLKYKISSENDIQPSFDRFNPFKNSITKTIQTNGKVLLYEYVLRFPPQVLKKNFNQVKTFILRKRRKEGYNNILPTYFLDQYQCEISSMVKKIQIQSMDIFSCPTCHPVFKNCEFQEKFIQTIPQLLMNLESIINCFKDVRISCVIVGTTEDSLSRSIVAVASLNGVPSICMQHGLIVREEGYFPVLTTKQAVYGEFEKKWYLSKGVLEQQIEIIGHPRFDEIFTKQYNNTLDRKLRLNTRKKWVLLATQPSDRSKWLKLISCLMKDHSIEIIIKPHPLEINNGDYLDYKILGSKYTRIKLISKNRIHLYEILSNVDIVVVNASTVGLEAILMGKPVAILKNDTTDYYDKLGEFVQSNPNLLAENIKRVLHDDFYKKHYEQRRKKFIAFSYPQQLSINRLIKVINELIN
ncbi:CDP-glycerol glycerophosphotransferase family protein [Alkalihalobacterium alkalinitrilicum]|uniref:capsular polysaccharide export protein, LipB/KpsS family n=1 Tax=Alkalihalobacterium alkalinitrilicum TaxID=427920 RepID=UPI0009954A33|nr:CDP-glycerol glycerophosphotransferase family protein [Alkalihalobacterium alkalinitrilicum]